MNVRKSTPILVVDKIERVLSFWESLGYEKVAAVPHGNELGFAILVRGDLELMLQTLASIREDVPAVAAKMRAGDVVLYHDVASLEEAKRATSSLELLIPERTTSYGAKEIFVRTADGHVLGFAQKTEETEKAES